MTPDRGDAWACPECDGTLFVEVHGGKRCARCVRGVTASMARARRTRTSCKPLRHRFPVTNTCHAARAVDGHVPRAKGKAEERVTLASGLRRLLDRCTSTDNRWRPLGWRCKPA